MTNDKAIELAKRAIALCKGVTLQALQIVIAMAEKYDVACDTSNHVNGISENLKQAIDDYIRLDAEAMRYLANGSDFFEIQAGPWSLKFDCTSSASDDGRMRDCSNRGVTCNETKCRAANTM